MILQSILGNANRWVDIDTINDDVDVTKGTIEIWMMPKALAAANSQVMLRNTANYQNQIAIFRWITNGVHMLRYRAGNVDKTIEVSLSNDTWYYLALTWDKTANQVKAYKDGSQTGSTLTGLGTWSGAVNGSALWAYENGDYPSNHRIAEVRVSKCARTSTEISAAWNRRLPFEADADTIALYHFDEERRQIPDVYDASAYKNHGLVENGTITREPISPFSYPDLPASFTYGGIAYGGPTPLTIVPSAIASAEAFGTASLGYLVGPDAIASAEAFGTAQLNMQVVADAIASAEAHGTPVVAGPIIASSITSEEAFGTPLVLSLTFISPTGIASSEAFGSPTMLPGGVGVSPIGITPAEAFGSPQLNFLMFPTGIASAEIFGTSKFTLYLLTDGIDSGEVFGTTVMGLALLPSSIGTGEAFGTSKLNLSVSLGGIASGEAFGTNKLILYLLPDGITSQEAIGDHTILPGVVIVEPSAIASGETFGSLSVIGMSVICPDGIISGEAFGVSTILPGLVTLLPSPISSSEAFGAHRLNMALLAIALASSETFGTAQLNLTLFAPAVESSETFGSLTVIGLWSINPLGIASNELFGTAEILPGGVLISPPGISSSEALGIARINHLIDASAIASEEQFGTAELIPGGVTVSPTGIVSAEQFGAASLLLYILPSGLASTETLGVPIITLGELRIIVPSIGSAEAFGTTWVFLEAPTYPAIAAKEFARAIATTLHGRGIILPLYSRTIRDQARTH